MAAYWLQGLLGSGVLGPVLVSAVALGGWWRSRSRAVAGWWRRWLEGWRGGVVAFALGGGGAGRGLSDGGAAGSVESWELRRGTPVAGHLQVNQPITVSKLTIEAASSGALGDLCGTYRTNHPRHLTGRRSSGSHLATSVPHGQARHVSPQQAHIWGPSEPRTPALTVAIGKPSLSQPHRARSASGHRHRASPNQPLTGGDVGARPGGLSHICLAGVPHVVWAMGGGYGVLWSKS